MFDQKLFRTNDVFFYKTWWHVKQLHVNFQFRFVVNASVIISEVINFCFTIAHETCDNKLLNRLWVWSRHQCLLYIKFLKMFLLNHSLIRFENSRIINIIIFIDDHVWCIRKQKRNYFEKLVSRCQKFFEKFIIFLLTWNSFEHEIFVSCSLKFSERFITFLRHDFCIIVWVTSTDLKNYYSRDFRIWQIRIDRFVCKNHRKTSNWRLFFDFDDIMIRIKCYDFCYSSIVCFETLIFTRTI